MAPPDLVVHVLESDFGLPSFHVDCSIVLVYLRIAGIPHGSVVVRNPLVRPVPSLADGRLRLAGLDSILHHVQAKRAAGEPSEPDERAWDVYLGRLRIAIDFSLWLDEEKYATLTLAWYRAALPFPFNLLFAKTQRRRLLQKYDTLLEHADAIVEDAKDCIDDLACKLGSRDSFSEEPSVVDAKVYTYLSFLVRVPGVIGDLHLHIAQRKNLVAFLDRISRTHFASLPAAPKYVKQAKEEAGERERAPAATLLVAGLCAAFAMYAFATINGLWKRDL